MSFQKALIQIKISEGGYANDPDDTGGETYMGVARKFHPNWEGWKFIDSLKAKKKLKTNQKFNYTTLNRFIRDFYHDKFWVKLRCDEINNPIVSEHLMDCGVNFGRNGAIKFIQESVNKNSGMILKIDGLIGPATINAINSTDKRFANKLVEDRIGLYFKKCRAQKYKFKYLKGWTLRSLKFLDNPR